MNFLGITIVTTKWYQGKLENAEHWKQCYKNKDQHCDNLVDKFTEERRGLNKELKMTQDHLRQKRNLLENKIKSIETLKALLKSSAVEFKNSITSANQQIKKYESALLSQDDLIHELRRVVKCLKENVRARNTRIEKLKAGIDVPAELKHATNKLNCASMKLARANKEKYDLLRRLDASKELIRKLKVAAKVANGVDIGVL